MLLEGKILSYNTKRKQYGKYGFRFYENNQNELANIWSVGWEEQNSPDYSWDGLKREDTGTYVFQYTLSGRGMIVIDGEYFPLNPGDAFLVKIPSRHHYFLPNDSSRWEFIYISLVGNEVASCWNFIKENLGPMINISFQEKIIQKLVNIYQETSERRITDTYKASARAYEFVMECYRFVKNIGKMEEELPNSVLNALYFIQKHYNESINLEDIADHVRLSKYYFIKQFRKHMNITPLQYLTKIRLEKAVELLRHTELSINEISNQVGYSNANYFNKVFRKAVGTSAGQFREGKTTIPVDHLILE